MALPIDPVTGLQNSTMQAPKAASSELGQVDFMKLIVAQMQNQNPLEPQSNTDFMAQMAQFEALNQMKAMADGMKVLQGVNELSSATSMLGKAIVGKTVDATGVTRDAVGREMYGAAFADLTTQQKSQVNLDSRVQAALKDSVNAGAEIAGTVDRVVVGPDGIPSLYVAGHVVDLFSISAVQ
jgi:flagellar basal-body rod modification protein FlgD